MSRGRRMRRIGPIASKCCIDLLYAVADPGKGPDPYFKTKLKFFCDHPPPYLRVWMTSPPPPKKKKVTVLLFQTIII